MERHVCLPGRHSFSYGSPEKKKRKQKERRSRGAKMSRQRTSKKRGRGKEENCEGAGQSCGRRPGQPVRDGWEERAPIHGNIWANMLAGLKRPIDGVCWPHLDRQVLRWQMGLGPGTRNGPFRASHWPTPGLRADELRRINTPSASRLETDIGRPLSAELMACQEAPDCARRRHAKPANIAATGRWVRVLHKFETASP